ncbi:MAG: hypothetical protein CM1200mP15_18820 [Dehalococcoidia bacterium]|nr:MAG: hypothetical protein CM1200mP15_18820 [Dehalococcoidia bacterium]
MNFDEFHLDSEILSGVKRKGFSEPTPIQHQSIPEALNGHDVLGLAQTGTGKTAAFLLPVIQKIHKDKSRHIKSLVVVPTRELAEQVYQDALEFAFPGKPSSYISNIWRRKQVSSNSSSPAGSRPGNRLSWQATRSYA